MFTIRTVKKWNWLIHYIHTAGRVPFINKNTYQTRPRVNQNRRAMAQCHRHIQFYNSVGGDFKMLVGALKRKGRNPILSAIHYFYKKKWSWPDGPWSPYRVLRSSSISVLLWRMDSYFDTSDSDCCTTFTLALVFSLVWDVISSMIKSL